MTERTAPLAIDADLCDLPGPRIAGQDDISRAVEIICSLRKIPGAIAYPILAETAEKLGITASECASYIISAAESLRRAESLTQAVPSA